MVLDLALTAIGLALLVHAADQFVLGSSRLAGLFDVSPVIIGAVVMGFGTSAPEMLVSGIAAAGGDRDLGVGNIVGSNVANLSLVLGVAALVTTMTIPAGVLRREIPLSIGSSVLFAVFVVDGSISRWEGAVLAGCLVVVVALLLRAGFEEGDHLHLESKVTRGREAARVVVGLIGTVGGAQLVVWGATDLADTWGVSGGFIGFSLVALGTSLPELVTTVACARRRETELIVGNLFGSNIFNALAVGGAMGLVGPGLIGDDSLTGIGLVLMLAVGVTALGLIFFGLFVGPRDGAVLLASYALTMGILGLTAESDEPTEAGSAVVEVSRADSGLQDDATSP